MDRLRHRVRTKSIYWTDKDEEIEIEKCENFYRKEREEAEFILYVSIWSPSASYEQEEFYYKTPNGKFFRFDRKKKESGSIYEYLEVVPLKTRKDLEKTMREEFLEEEKAQSLMKKGEEWDWEARSAHVSCVHNWDNFVEDRGIEIFVGKYLKGFERGGKY